MKFYPISIISLFVILLIGTWSCRQENLFSEEVSLLEHNLEFEKNDLGVLYPIPIQEHLNLVVAGQEQGDGLFEIFDLEGNLIRKDRRSLIKGINKMELALPGLASGFYLLRLSQKGELLFQQKFIVQ